MLQISLAGRNKCFQITLGIDKNAPILACPSNYPANMKNNMLWNDCKNWMTCPATLLRDIARKNNISEVLKAKIVSREKKTIRQAQFQDGNEICNHYG